MADISQFYGTYRGFSPTDESPIGLGELEVTINEQGVTYKMATGLEVITEHQDAKFVPLTREEIAQEYTDGDYADRTAGFRAEPDGLKYLFLPDASLREFGLVLRGNELADLLGPTLLLNPRQQKLGGWALLSAAMRFSKGFPRIKYDGKVPPKLTDRIRRILNP